MIPGVKADKSVELKFSNRETGASQEMRGKRLRAALAQLKEQ